MRAGGLVGIVSVALLGLVGCAYRPGDVDNPLTRKFTWISFLAGDDIRAACQPGSPDRFRLVYNGHWNEQVRVYEIGFAGLRRLDERVIGPADMFELSLTDPLGPWRGVKSSKELSQPEYESLMRALADSGAYRSPAQTLTLTSDSFYWVAASCHAGEFHLTGWLYPSDGFAHATFVGWLAAIDDTQIAFNPPRPWYEAASAPYAADINYKYQRGVIGPWAVGIVDDRLSGGSAF